MSKLSLILRTFRKQGPAVPAAFAALHSPEQLRHILKRERARADRSGIGFVLLKFIPRDVPNAEPTLVCLAEILNSRPRRLRFVDEAGWLGDHEIGVVLPYTSVADARRVAGDVYQAFGDLEPPRCEIYYYPSEPPVESPDPRDSVDVHQESDMPVGAMEPLLAEPIAMWKRSLDIFGAATALLLLSPLLAVVAVAIKLNSPGPVFFSQMRAGLGGRPIRIHKLRTMHCDADAIKHQLREQNEVNGAAFKIKDDPRITGIGHFLRRTSIDELPQFWNVLKGEMSLVGPRPLPCDESAACTAWQKERLTVTPGLTCIWQVRGRSLVTFDEWMRMDLDYIDNKSFSQDLRILAATVPAVLFGKGAY